MVVFGIESSCDETAVAIYDSAKGLVDDKIYSQIAIHSNYGGVVPELASRDHQKQLIPLVTELLQQNSLSLTDIDVFAYTAGPGLSGALLTGAMFATALAFSLGKPAVPVHHMEGHLLAPMLNANNNCDFPFLALLVSGGHTEFIAAKSYRDYKKIGDTLDDAAGETFDKVAVMLGLDYPGGPAIAKLAAQCSDLQAVSALNFPRPMVNRQGIDFSFSGLKTYTKNTILKLQQSGNVNLQTKATIAFALQQAVAETIAIKCARAIDMTGINHLILAGGVAANKYLRQHLQQYLAKKFKQVNISYPDIKYCTDNAAMIAYAGYLDYKNHQASSYSVNIRPRWDIGELRIEN